MTEILDSELKNNFRISFFYRIVNCCMNAQSKALQQSVEQVYGAGGIGEVYSCNYCTHFGRHRRHLVNTSKIHGLDLTKILPYLSCQT